MRTLIVYYSLSGTTRAVAEALAKELAADVEEIRCARYALSAWGVLKAGYDSWRGRLPAVEPLMHEPSRYDLVVVGGPIWSFHPATPVRSWLKREAPRLAAVALFLTHGGSAGERSLGELEEIAGQGAQARLLVRQAEVQNGAFLGAVARFAQRLRRGKAA